MGCGIAGNSGAMMAITTAGASRSAGALNRCTVWNLGAREGFYLVGVESEIGSPGRRSKTRVQGDGQGCPSYMGRRPSPRLGQPRRLSPDERRSQSQKLKSKTDRVSILHGLPTHLTCC